MSPVPFVPGTHLNLGQKIDTTISFTNPDNGLPGSLSFKGQVVANPDSTWSLMVSSVSYAQQYEWYANNPSTNPKDVISLFTSKAVPHALALRMSALDTAKHVLTLQAVDDHSTMWKAVLCNGPVDSVWRNDETRMHGFKDWNTKIDQFGKGTGYVSFNLTVSRDFSAGPYEVRLLDSTARGRLPFMFDNVTLTAPTMEGDVQIDLVPQRVMTIQLAKTKTGWPDVTYTYKDTTITNALTVQTKIFANAEKYSQLLNTLDIDYGMKSSPVYPLNFILGMTPAMQSQYNNYYGYFPPWITYQGNSARMIIPTPINDTAYHYTDLYIGQAYGVNMWMPGTSSPKEIKWDASASMQWWGAYLKPKGGTSVDAMVESLRRNPMFLITTHFGAKGDSAIRYGIKYRLDDATGRYILDASHVMDGYMNKDTNTVHLVLDPNLVGKFMRLHENNSTYQDSIVGVTSDSTDGDGLRVRAISDSSLRMTINERPKIGEGVVPYPISESFHNIHQILPEYNAILVDPKSVSFSWNAGLPGFAYHLQVAKDAEMSNVVMDTLMSDTTAIMNSMPKTTTHYYWKVKAENLQGDGPQSGISSFTIQLTDTTHSSVKPTIQNEKRLQVFPNPAASEMRISYSIPKHSTVALSVFDMTGKEITIIASQERNAGSYETVWDTKAFASGSYILKLTACGESVTKVVEILR